MPSNDRGDASVDISAQMAFWEQELVGLPVQDLYMIATIPFVIGAVVAFIMMPMFAERMATHGPGR